MGCIVDCVFDSYQDSSGSVNIRAVYEGKNVNLGLSFLEVDLDVLSNLEKGDSMSLCFPYGSSYSSESLEGFFKGGGKKRKPSRDLNPLLERIYARKEDEGGVIYSLLYLKDFDFDYFNNVRDFCSYDE